jgi:hypothetical protein
MSGHKLASLCLVVVACGGKTDAEPAGDASNNGDGGDGFEAFVYPDSSQAAGIPSVSVCLSNHPEFPCTTTGSDGGYYFPLPFAPVVDGQPPQPLAFTATAPGYQTQTEVLTIQSAQPATFDEPAQFSLMPIAEAAGIAAQAGYDYPAPKSAFASVLLTKVDADASTGVDHAFMGAELVLTASDGTVLHPVYSHPYAPTVAWDPTLTSCPADCQALFGGIPPGSYTITIEGTTLSCTHMGTDVYPQGTWPTDVPNAIAGYAVAGSWNDLALFVCN